MKKNFYTFLTLLSLIFTLTLTMNVSATELPEEPTYQSDIPSFKVDAN